MSEGMAGQGRLRTYLGIAPGVGKTYAMLRDGRARQRAGVDVVVAYLERHGRAATAAVLDRHPGLALVDELAHTNLPGERHAKRWQDVGELLANGIDVATTLNVANIESLGVLVSRITGVHPAEQVPDAFVRSGEITLVSCGGMRLFPIRSPRSWPPTMSASPCKPRSSWSAWRGRPPTNGSSATPPISPGCRMPGSMGSGPATLRLG
jgi:K+-sensing histidine kinase KdpD